MTESDPPDAVAEVVRLLGVLTSRVESLRGVVARELDISPTDLRALYYIGLNPGMTPKHVAEALDITTGSVTPLLDRLESHGFMERRPHPADRRSMTLYPTPAGRHAREWGTAHFRRAAQLAIDSSDRLDTDLALDLLIGMVAGLDQITAGVQD